MAKKKKRVSRKRAGRKAAGAGAAAAAGGREGRLGTVSTDALARELRRRQGDLRRLEARRERLAAELARIDKEINEVGGAGGFGTTARGGLRRRPKNESNLADALVQVLTGQTMGVSEVAEAVQAAGYRTSSPNFRTIVNQTLIKDKRIKKVSRGQYTAK